MFTGECWEDLSEASSLLCTTAEGWLQRVVVLGADTHVIEEIQLFETAQPVDSLTISHSKVRRRWDGYQESGRSACRQRELEMGLRACFIRLEEPNVCANSWDSALLSVEPTVYP